MASRMRRLVSIMLAITICLGSVSAMADSSGKKIVGSSEGLQRYPEGMTEKQAGILTEEASNEIKRKIQQQGLTDIEHLLDPYFDRMVKTGFYDDSLNTSREVTAKAGSDTPLVEVGTTKYTKEYDNSGIFTYRTRSGLYSSIFHATIATFLGEVKDIGVILSWVYSVVSGYEPNTQAEASAKTMYSYRYTEEKGWVYYYDWEYDYFPRATVVSRDTCEHYWGQYVDVEGFARQKTRDLGIKRSENAPHKGNSTWIRNKAKTQWQGNLPHYYEDWQ